MVRCRVVLSLLVVTVTNLTGLILTILFDSSTHSKSPSLFLSPSLSETYNNVPQRPLLLFHAPLPIVLHTRSHLYPPARLCFGLTRVF